MTLRQVNVRCLVPDQLKRDGAIVGLDRLKAFCFDNANKQLSYGALVINN